MTDDMSHDEYLEQGITDYENTFKEWDIDMMVDQIVILSEYKNKITILIQKMKRDLINSYEEKEAVK